MADLAGLERGLWTLTGTSRLSPIALQFVSGYSCFTNRILTVIKLTNLLIAILSISVQSRDIFRDGA